MTSKSETDKSDGIEFDLADDRVDLDSNVIRSMADLILLLCRCRRCGKQPPHAELTESLRASHGELVCQQCQNS